MANIRALKKKRISQGAKLSQLNRRGLIRSNRETQSSRCAIASHGPARAAPGRAAGKGGSSGMIATQSLDV